MLFAGAPGFSKRYQKRHQVPKRVGSVLVNASNRQAVLVKLGREVQKLGCGISFVSGT